MLFKMANGGICLQGNGHRSGLGPEGCRLGLGAIRKGLWRSKIGVGVVELIEGIEGIEGILLAVEALYENASAPLREAHRMGR
jgi:hypothetical protein